LLIGPINPGRQIFWKTTTGSRVGLRRVRPELLGFPGSSQPCGYEALEIKELSHRLDGVHWPREPTGCAETGSPEFPVVLLEVQMHPDPGFHHRLAAQTYRFLQQQPQVEHWAVLVITPHNRLKLGPTKALQVFLEQQVVWLSLEELSQQPDLDPQLTTAVSSRGQKSW
jgi:hypothetical protein